MKEDESVDMNLRVGIHTRLDAHNHDVPPLPPREKLYDHQTRSPDDLEHIGDSYNTEKNGGGQGADDDTFDEGDARHETRDTPEVEFHDAAGNDEKSTGKRIHTGTQRTATGDGRFVDREINERDLRVADCEGRRESQKVMIHK